MSDRPQNPPEGYSAVTPYLFVSDGHGAIEFYREAFGAVVATRVDRPVGGLLHAELRIEGAPVMLCQTVPESGFSNPTELGGCTSQIYLYVADVDATFAQAMRAGAHVIGAVLDTFWGERVATVSDPFGHLWVLATRTKTLPPEKVAEGLRAALEPLAPQDP